MFWNFETKFCRQRVALEVLVDLTSRVTCQKSTL
jgi:hypothetical protein